MRRWLGLGLGVFFVLGCGGSDGTIPGLDGGDEGSNPGMDGSGGGDTGNNDGGMGDSGGDGGMMLIGTFVSGATGNDTNPGTQQSPVKTIAQGMKLAAMLGGKQTVYVANSHYPEKITMVEGITLLGGYHCDMMTCDWMRNPPMWDTAILNTDNEGVLAPASITRATSIDGFRIQGMSGGASSYAITVLGSPTISRNRINGGDVTNGRTVAVGILAPLADPNGPLVDNNDIQGGNATQNAFSSYGVIFDWIPNPPPNSTSTGQVRNNRIRGGNGGVTSGINALSCTGTSAIIGNTIASGNGPNGVANASWGMQLFGTVLVDSNLVNTNQQIVGGCNAQNWCGGIASFSSTSTISNNVVYGNKSPLSTAIYLAEAEKAAGVVVLNSNFLDGAGVGIQGNLTRSAGIVQHIYTGVNSVIGRERNNIIQGGINLFRYGIYEDQVPQKTNKPEVVAFNQFYFPPLQGRTDAFWHQWNGAVGTDIVIVPAMNQSGDPMVDATWHLQNGSPCIDKGTNTEAPAKDRDGNNRPMGQGFDIGADEK